jgi:hypothetical protein
VEVDHAAKEEYSSHSRPEEPSGWQEENDHQLGDQTGQHNAAVLYIPPRDNLVVLYRPPQDAPLACPQIDSFAADEHDHVDYVDFSTQDIHPSKLHCDTVNELIYAAKSWIALLPQRQQEIRNSAYFLVYDPLNVTPFGLVRVVYNIHDTPHSYYLSILCLVSCRMHVAHCSSNVTVPTHSLPVSTSPCLRLAASTSSKHLKSLVRS